MNKPYLDYLRLGSWDTTEYVMLLSKLYEKQNFTPYKWLQYKGKRSEDGTIFHGLGSQGRGELERRHSIMQFSGPKAHEWRRVAASWESFYCTRLDVQVTIEEPPEHKGAELYARLHRKQKRLIESPGASTVYIGARRSPLFTRIYEKHINDKRYLRCEFELKGEYSKRAWASYQNGDVSVSEIFATCHERAKIPSPWCEWFLVGADTHFDLLKSQGEADTIAKLQWIQDTETGLERAFYAHETHGAVAAMIERLEIMRQIEDGDENGNHYEPHK